MISKAFEISAVAIFIAISLDSRSVTVIVPYVAKVFSSGEGHPSPILCILKK